ncbi:hypothetical protein GCM10011428_40430 [Streptomyces violaceus]
MAVPTIPATAPIHTEVLIGTIIVNHRSAAEASGSRLPSEKLAVWREAAEKAVTMDDVWAGLCHFLETVCELQSQDQGSTTWPRGTDIRTLSAAAAGGQGNAYEGSEPYVLG